MQKVVKSLLELF